MKRNPLTIIIFIFIAIPLYAETIQIQLKPGWNGICVPVNITQQAISDYVNNDQVSEIKAMINGKWIYYHNQPDDELTQFHPGYGYMVKAKKAFQLSFEGSPVGYPSLVQGDNFVCLPTDNESTVNELLSRYRSKNWGIQRIGAYDGHWGPGWGSANGTIFDAFTQIEPNRGYTVKVTKVGEAIEDIDPVDQPEHLDTFSNSLGMTFVYIEAGSYTMGSPSDEPGRGYDETQHYVSLSKGYFIQTTEVTQGQWKEIMGRNPSRFSNCGDDCPVEQVSWNDVQSFIEKLNQKEMMHTYRLPTEAEWEYAARSGTSTALYNGPIEILGKHNAPALDAIAWYGGNSCVSYDGGYNCSSWSDKQYSCSNCGTHQVGLKHANAWGLYDMIGNVREWCSDWYGSYPSSTVESPVIDPVGPESGSYRVYRGGSWNSYAKFCRSALRFSFRPGLTDNYLGFRLVCAPRTVADSNRK